MKTFIIYLARIFSPQITNCILGLCMEKLNNSFSAWQPFQYLKKVIKSPLSFFVSSWHFSNIPLFSCVYSSACVLVFPDEIPRLQPSTFCQINAKYTDTSGRDLRSSLHWGKMINKSDNNVTVLLAVFSKQLCNLCCNTCCCL